MSGVYSTRTPASTRRVGGCERSMVLPAIGSRSACTAWIRLTRSMIVLIHFTRSTYVVHLRRVGRWAREQLTTGTAEPDRATAARRQRAGVRRRRWPAGRRRSHDARRGVRPRRNRTPPEVG